MEGTVTAPAAPAQTLPTALLGFRKSDVLTYIDELIAANAKHQQALQADLDSLQTQLAEAQQDKETLLGKTKEICEKLSGEEQTTKQLHRELAEAREESAGFKAKLFTAEQDKALMKGEHSRLEARVAELEAQLATSRSVERELAENRAEIEQREQKIAALNLDKEALCAKIAQLNTDKQQADTAAETLSAEKETLLGQLERITEDKRQLALQVETLEPMVREYKATREQGTALLERANRQAAETLRSARLDADKIVADANRAAVDLREDAEQMAKERQTELVQTTAEVAGSIDTLRAELAEVERRMDSAYNSLREAASKIEQAVDLAEKKMSEMTPEVKLPIEPEQPNPAQARVQAAIHRSTPYTAAPTTKSLSDIVLEKLGKLLG